MESPGGEGPKGHIPPVSLRSVIRIFRPSGTPGVASWSGPWYPAPHSKLRVPCPPDSCHLWGCVCWEPWEQGRKLGGSIKVPTCIWQRSIKARIPAKHHSSPKREKKILRRSSQRPTVINRRKRPPMRTSTVWTWPCRLKRCCRCSSVGRGCHCLSRHLLEISWGQPVSLLSCLPPGSCQLP